MRFVHSMLLQASLEQVAAFHHDARALKLLTPLPVVVQLHEVQPLSEGSIADFTMWLGPLPVHWRAVHSNIDLLRGFTDTQVSGPFRCWVHRHSFSPVSEETTLVTDEIEAEYGSHPFWGLVSRFMGLNLPVLFAYREWVTRQALKKMRIQSRMAQKG